MRWLIFWFIFLFTITVSAQQIRVVDIESGAAVERVLIHSPDGSISILTNTDGKARIDMFPDTSLLIFQHPAYQAMNIEKLSIPANNIIILNRRIIELSELVVSANKWEQNRSEIPGRITSIGPTEIRNQNLQTSADALAATGEVYIQKSQMGGGSPMLRGFSANSVLIVVDGVRMNNAIFRSGNLQNVIMIDPLTIDNTEVIFGPGSVIYGSDALGGVMDFHTIRPALSYDTSTFVRSEYYHRVATANQDFTQHIQLNVGWKKFALFTSITNSPFSSLKAGANYPSDYPDFGKRTHYQAHVNGKDTIFKNPDPEEQIGSGYKQLNINQKVRYRPSNEWDFEYGFRYSTTNDIPRYDRLTIWDDSLLQYAEWYYGPQKWLMNQLRIDHYSNNFYYDQARLLITHQNMEESRHDRKFGEAWLRHRTEKVNAYIINFDANKNTGARAEVFYGLEGVINTVNSRGFEENIYTFEGNDISSRYPGGNNLTYSFAAYLQHKYQALERLTVQTGLRYSHSGIRSTLGDNPLALPYEDIELDHGAFNGSVGMVYKTPGVFLYRFNISSGFRSPNLDDVAKIFDSEPGSVIVPNPALRPEFAYNFEGGIGFKKDQQISIDLDAWYTFVEDVMVREDFSFNGQDSILYDGSPSNVQALVNSGRARIYGFSLNAYASLGEHWALRQSLTWMDGYEVDGDIPLRHTPPLFGKTSIAWEIKDIVVTAYVEYNGWKRWEDLAPSEQAKAYLYTEDGSPAWYTINLNANFVLNPKFSIAAGIENILDRHYRTYSSGISAPGRNIVMSVRGTF